MTMHAKNTMCIKKIGMLHVIHKSSDCYESPLATTYALHGKRKQNWISLYCNLAIELQTSIFLLKGDKNPIPFIKKLMH